MKTTLTKDDPKGWYLCDYVYDDCNFNFHAKGMLVQWTGDSLIYCGDLVHGNDWAGLSNFRPIGDEVFNEELQTLRAELDALRKQPYAIRKAEKPDCVGLWANRDGSVLEIYNVHTSPRHGPPYYHLGPIPVIPVEQQPPQVVTIRHEGKTYRAIPSDNPEYWTLLGDDGVTCGVAIGKVEAVQ